MWSLPRRVGPGRSFADKCGQTPGYSPGSWAGERPATRPGVLRAATQHESLAHVSHRRPLVCPGSLCSQGPLSRGPRGLIWILPWKLPHLGPQWGPLCSLRTRGVAAAGASPESSGAGGLQVPSRGAGSSSARCPPPRCPSSFKGPPCSSLQLLVSQLPVRELAVGRWAPA